LAGRLSFSDLLGIRKATWASARRLGSLLGDGIPLADFGVEDPAQGENLKLQRKWSPVDKRVPEIREMEKIVITRGTQPA
jgi:hypothetical protein